MPLLSRDYRLPATGKKVVSLPPEPVAKPIPGLGLVAVLAIAYLYCTVPDYSAIVCYDWKKGQEEGPRPRRGRKRMP